VAIPVSIQHLQALEPWNVPLILVQELLSKPALRRKFEYCFLLAAWLGKVNVATRGAQP
jgi:hypothetical protein